MLREDMMQDDNSVQRGSGARRGDAETPLRAGQASDEGKTDPAPWGAGPVIFREGTSAKAKRRRLVFCAVTLLVGSALIWPVYPRFATVEPMVAGLPFGMAWVIAVLIAMFVNTLLLYRSDLQHDDLAEASRDRDGEAS